MRLLLVVGVSLGMACNASPGGLTVVAAEPPKDAGAEVRPPPVDAGPKLGAFCLPNAAPIVLPQPAPSLTETPRFLWAKTITQGFTADPQGLTLSGDRLAMTGVRDIWILDLDGNVVQKVGDRTSLAVTTAIGDGRGNFFYSANRVVSLDRDGNMRWEFRFGPPAVPTEFGYTRGLVVSPDGGVYFGASDLQIHALSAADGHVLWERPYTGTNSGTQVGPADVAVGDAVFVDWVAYDRRNGTPLGVLPYQGYPAGFSRFNSRYEANVYQLPRTTGVVDRCGREVLQRDESPQWRFTYGFEDETIVNDFSVKDPARPGLRSAFVEGADRQPLTSRQDVDWTPLLVGADGITYGIEGDGNTSRLVAVARDLRVLYRIPIPAPLTFDAVLLDDGRLYLDTYDEATTARTLVAVQTASPGLAKTASPSLFGDNTRSGWYGPWPRY